MLAVMTVNQGCSGCSKNMAPVAPKTSKFKKAKKIDAVDIFVVPDVAEVNQANPGSLTEPVDVVLIHPDRAVPTNPVGPVATGVKQVLNELNAKLAKLNATTPRSEDPVDVTKPTKPVVSEPSKATTPSEHVNTAGDRVMEQLVNVLNKRNHKVDFKKVLSELLNKTPVASAKKYLPNIFSDDAGLQGIAKALRDEDVISDDEEVDGEIDTDMHSVRANPELDSLGIDIDGILNLVARFLAANDSQFASLAGPVKQLLIEAGQSDDSQLPPLVGSLRAAMLGQLTEEQKHFIQTFDASAANNEKRIIMHPTLFTPIPETDDHFAVYPENEHVEEIDADLTTTRVPAALYIAGQPDIYMDGYRNDANSNVTFSEDDDDEPRSGRIGRVGNDVCDFITKECIPFVALIGGLQLILNFM